MTSAALAAAASLVAASTPVGAATYYYDQNLANPGIGGANTTGSWNLSNQQNWRQGTTTGTIGKWPGSSAPSPSIDTVNGDVAVFTETPGTVGLGSGTLNIQVNRIDFEIDGYVINANGGSFLNFVTPTNNTAPVVNVTTGSANLRPVLQGSFTKQGDGTLIMSYFAVSPQVGHTVSAVNVADGTLRAGSVYAFGTNASRASVSLSGGTGTTLDLNGFIATVMGNVHANAITTVGSLSGAAGSVIKNTPTYLPANTAASSATLVVGAGSNAATTFAGSMQDGTFTSALQVGTAGSTPSLTLTGTNTYTGGTTVQSGNLLLDGGGSIIAASTTITGGSLAGIAGGTDGTINFRINGDTSDLISISGTGVLGLSNLTLNLVLSGEQALDEYILANKPTGSAFVGGSAFGVESLPSGWSIDYNGTDANPNSIVLVAPVPEPAGMTAFTLGFAGMLVRRRRGC